MTCGPSSTLFHAAIPFVPPTSPTIVPAQYNIQSKIYTAVLRMNKCHENLARRMPEIRRRLADYGRAL